MAKVEQPLSPAVSALAPGVLVGGRFRLTGILGEGGMAVVVAAHHEGLDMPVALKVMKTEAAMKPEVRARFAREAKAVATLRSEHVARVLDVGETDDGRPYLVIEHLEGRDLARVLATEGSLTISRAVDFVMQAAVGLAEAHARGIVHRDIKPANLFVTREPGFECIKVLDFGISKVLGVGAANPVITTSELMGSPAYMSPEQLRSAGHVDARSDLWSLGAVLFELLAGTPPFGGLNVDFYNVISAILHDATPSLRDRRGDVSPGLAALVARCLEKDASTRFSSAVDLLVALAPFGGPRAAALVERGAAASRPQPALPPTPPNGSATYDDPARRVATDSTAATVLLTPQTYVATPRVPLTPLTPLRVSALRPAPLARSKCASGQSLAPDTVKATREAFARAQPSLAGRPVSLAFLFASSRHDIGRATAELGALTGDAPVLSCTTAGEITERGLSHRGLAVFLIACEDMRTLVNFTDALETDLERAVAELTEGFDAAALAARQDGCTQSMTVALLDGLSTNGEPLVEGLLAHTRGYQRLVGGAAGDDGAFQKTHVAAKGRSAVSGAAAAHVFASKPWGIGVAHGLSPATDRMRVTKARGNRIYEIEKRPAFEAYRAFAKQRDGIDLTPERAASFLVQNEMGVYYFDNVRHARAAIRVESDGSLVCAGTVPEGASVCFLTGDPESMLQAARAAALEAAEQLKGQPAAGVLVFDCVCREAILGAKFEREIAAIAGVFPHVPVGGFLTYGEIARARGRLEGWHNATVVVVAVPA